MPRPSRPAVAPGMNAGIAWANDPSGLGWTPILGGSSAVAREPAQGLLREAEARLQRRASRRSRRRPRGSAAAAGRSCRESRPAGLRGTFARLSAWTSRRASRTSSSSRTRSSCTTASRRSRRTRDGRRPSATSRPTSGVTRTSGRPACATWAPPCPPPGRPRARVRLIILTARVFGTRAVSDLVKALEGDEEALYDAQGDSPDIEAIAADEREHAEIWKRLDDETATAIRPGARGAARRRGRLVTASEHPSVDAGRARAPRRSPAASAGTGAPAPGRCGRSSSASRTAWCPTSPW